MSADTYESDVVYDEQVDAASGQLHPYRAVSKAAALSVIFAILSLSGLLTPFLLVFPLAACVFGVIGATQIRKYPDELTGLLGARLAIIAGLVMFVLGTALHGTIYATEVPEGYTRISFADLQPTRKRPDLPVSPTALELNGKRVFVKGYVYPGEQRIKIKRFILVPDMGTCCFGGTPKATDMIEVTLKDPLRVDFARRRRKLAGVLRVELQLGVATNGPAGVYYRLEADYLR